MNLNDSTALVETFRPDVNLPFSIYLHYTRIAVHLIFIAIMWQFNPIAECHWKIPFAASSVSLLDIVEKVLFVRTRV